MCLKFIYMKRAGCNIVTGEGGKTREIVLCCLEFSETGFRWWTHEVSSIFSLKLSNVSYRHISKWRNQSHHCTELWTTKFWHWSNKGHSWIRHSKWHPRKTDRSLGVCYIWRPMYVFCLNLTLKQNYYMIWTPVIFLFINCTCNASKRK